MNMLSKSDVFAEDKLFATLDSTVRKVFWDDTEFLLSDTVGFIRKLRHQLVECFKSTLDEIREADLLLHVVDISHASFSEQIDVVTQTLQEIGAGNKPAIMVFNKIDKLTVPDDLKDDYTDDSYLQYLKNTWMSKENIPCVFISAEKKINIAGLRAAMLKQLKLLKPASI